MRSLSAVPCLFGDCTSALFASPSPGIRALGLSGNYPDGSTGNLPIIPAHIKTKPLWREHDYFTGINERMQEEFFEKPPFCEPFFGDSSRTGWLKQYSRAGGKNPAKVSERFFDPAAKAARSGVAPAARGFLCVWMCNGAFSDAFAAHPLHVSNGCYIIGSVTYAYFRSYAETAAAYAARR